MKHLSSGEQKQMHLAICFPMGIMATIIKGQDAMFGHGGNVTLKGGNIMEYRKLVVP